MSPRPPGRRAPCCLDLALDVVRCERGGAGFRGTRSSFADVPDGGTIPHAAPQDTALSPVHCATLVDGDARLWEACEMVSSGGRREHCREARPESTRERWRVPDTMAILTINPQRIGGQWVEGFTLDDHTISSEFLGYDGGGYPRFDTQRTALGECIYQLKNRGGPAGDIIETATAFVTKHWAGRLDCVTAAPPSLSRTNQPAVLIAKGIADSLGVEYMRAAVIKPISTPQVKNVTLTQDRQALLSKAIQPGSDPVRGMRILIVDDLWDTGSTLRRVASVLGAMGASEVRVLA